MRSVGEIARSLREQRRIRRTKLPWRELEAEAQRQGCSPADIFFDRAGRSLGAGVLEAADVDDRRASSDPRSASRT